MELKGIVRNGVIVLTGGVSLPEGTAVRVSTDVAQITPPPVTDQNRVTFPLVHSSEPGTIHLTNERIGEIFDEEEAAAARR
jgi:hypothetical protein